MKYNPEDYLDCGFWACLPRVEVWLEESGQVGFDNEDGEQDER